MSDLLSAESLNDPQDPQPAPPIGRDPEPQLSIYRQNIRKRREQAQQQLVESFNVGVKSDPVKAREADRYAQQLGLPVGVAERNLDQVSAIVARRAFDSERMAALNPTLAQQLRDPAFAKMAFDDVGNLSTYERAMRAARLGELTVERGLAASDLWMGDNPAAAKRLAAIDEEMSRIPESRGIIANAAEQSGLFGKVAYRALGTGLATAGAVAVAGQLGPQIATPEEIVTVPAAFAAGATGSMLVDFARINIGNEFANLTSMGVPRTTAQLTALGVGAVNTALDVGGLSMLTAPVRSVLKRGVREVIAEGAAKATVGSAAIKAAIEYAKAGAGEVGTEMLQEVVSAVGEATATGDPSRLDGLAKRVGEVGLKTAQAMVLLSAPGPVMQFHQDVRRINAAKQAQRHLDEMMAATPDSKMLAQNPEAFRRVVDAADPGIKLYFDGKTLADAMAQQDEQQAATSPDVLKKRIVERMPEEMRERLVKAIESGGDFVLTPGEFLTAFGNTAEGKALQQHARINDPAGMTGAEAASADIEKMAKDAEKQATEQEAEAKKWNDEAKAVEDSFAAEALSSGRVKKGEAAGFAKLWRTFVEVQAEDIGDTPKALAERYRVAVKAGEVAGDAMAQGGTKTDTPEFKAWFGESKVVDESGKPLVVYHGSKSPTEDMVFDFSKIGSNGRSEGAGFYFTTDAKIAEGYARDGGTMIRSWLAINKPMPLEQKGFTVAQLRKIVRRAAELEAAAGEGDVRDGFLSNFGDTYTNLGGVISEAAKMIGADAKAVDQMGGMVGSGLSAEFVNRAVAEVTGFDGIVSDGFGGAGGRGGRIFVAFFPEQIKSVNNRGTFDPNDPNILRQDGDVIRGGFKWIDGRPTIILTPEKNDSTLFHESGHAFLDIYADMAAQKMHPRIVDNFGEFLKWTGVESAAAWQKMDLEQRRPHHEKFAREFEAWLWEGKEPAAGLRRLFSSLMRFLRRAYNALLEIPNATGSEDIRRVFDRMFASEREVKVAQEVRGAVPAFQTQEESGLDDAAWAKHVERQKEADAAAVDELTKHDLRNMKWLRNAKSGKLREIQKEVARLREGERQSVAKKVEQQPVYRAMRWLKTGEFINPDGTKTTDGQPHKMHRGAVRDLLGLKELDETAETKVEKPKAVKRGPSLVTRIKQLGGISSESWNKSWPGERKGEWKIPFVVRKSGMPWDYMARQLQAEGYGPQNDAGDGIGSGDDMWLVDALADAASGNATYSQLLGQADKEVPAGPNLPPESPDERADRIEAERLDAEQERARSAAIQVAKPERELGKLRGMLAETGYAPDDVAKLFEFETGEQMVRSILDAAPMEEAIESQTDLAMMEKHTDLVDQRKRDETIDRALMNEARRRFVLSELSVMTKAQQPERVTLAAAKKAAEVAIGRMRVKDINPRAFVMAARRLSRQAVEAQKAGDMPAAIAAKRGELVQQQLAIMAIDVRDEVRKAESLFAKFGRTGKDLAKSIVVDYGIVARALAAKYGFVPKIEAGRQEQQANEAMLTLTDEQPAMMRNVLDLIAEAGRGDGLDYRNVALSLFREVADLGQQLWDAGREARVVDADGKRREVSEIDSTLIGRIDQLPPRGRGTSASDGGSPSPWQRRVLKFWEMFAGIKIAEHWTHFMDGGKVGPFTREITQRVMKAAAEYDKQMAAMTRKFRDLLADAEKRAGAAWTSDLYTGPDLDFTFRGKHELLHAILLSGSETGHDKWLLGRKGKNGKTLGDVVLDADGEQVTDATRWNAFVASKWKDGYLTEEDAKWLAKMWGLFAELLPQAQKAHKRRFGYEFETIKLRPLATPFGALEGGYVPARTDSALVKPPANDSIDALDRMQYSVGSVKGFTMKRNPHYLKPLSIDLTKLLGHLSEELRFIHLENPTNDVMRILRGSMEVENPDGTTTRIKLRDKLDAYDREAVDGILIPMLQNAALQRSTRRGGSPFIDSMLTFMRRATLVARLGFAPAATLVQITGIANVFAQVKAKHAIGAIGKVFKNIPAALREARELSPVMLERFNDETRILASEVDRAAMKPVARAYKATRDIAERWAIAALRMVQMMADLVAWHAGYAEGVEMRVDPVQYADGVARRSQGSDKPQSQSRITSSTPLVKALGQFGNYGNLALNGILGSQSKARGAFWILFAPALAEMAIRMAIKALSSDDDETDETLAGNYLATIGRNAAGMIPVVGPMAVSLAQSEGARVAESPFVSTIKDSVRGLWAMAEAAGGDDVTASEARAILAFWSVVTGLPISGPARTVQEMAGVGR